MSAPHFQNTRTEILSLLLPSPLLSPAQSFFKQKCGSKPIIKSLVVILFLKQTILLYFRRTLELFGNGRCSIQRDIALDWGKHSRKGSMENMMTILIKQPVWHSTDEKSQACWVPSLGSSAVLERISCDPAVVALYPGSSVKHKCQGLCITKEGGEQDSFRVANFGLKAMN